ncbi:Nif3-like dinuclear metal center hexameric protein [Clostridium neuense]|uniref:GTP cyclohydrolase 1 type 2 homolog n=1 Tax=Clostridium neuense TaxID=1728934 RepID=A0ABW8TF81_9CLOT
MSFKVKDLCYIIEEFAPKNLKEDYDNVGLMVGNTEAEVNSVLMALDCTLDVIDEAVLKKCNTIVTHHPLLFRRPNSITNETLQGTKILRLAENKINLYSAHTNFDSVQGGLNDIIVELLGFGRGKVIAASYGNDNSGIGRLVELRTPITLENLCLNVKNKLGIKKLRYCGNDNTKIYKVAIINGSGQDFFESSKKLGVQCIITGDTSYHYVSDYNELGMCIIDAGHFGTEWPAVKVAASKLQSALDERKLNIDVYVSNSNVDPYKIK